MATAAKAGPSWKVAHDHVGFAFTDIAHLDMDHGYLAGSQSGIFTTIYHTSNACKNYTKCDVAPHLELFSVAVGGPKNAGACGPLTLFMSHDGVSFNKTKAGLVNFGASCNDIAHVRNDAPGTFYAVGEWFDLSKGGSFSGVARTTDGGLSFKGFEWPWGIDDGPNGFGPDATSGAYPSADVWYVSGGNYPSGGDGRGDGDGDGDGSGNMYRAVVAGTKDGGKTWTKMFDKEEEGGFTFAKISCPTEEKCWALANARAGTDGGASVYHTADGGSSWSVQLHVTGTTCINDLAFVSETEGWLAGGNCAVHGWTGWFWHSVDGGGTFTKVTVPKYVGLKLDLLDPAHGHALGVTIDQQTSVLAYA